MARLSDWMGAIAGFGEGMAGLPPLGSATRFVRYCANRMQARTDVRMDASKEAIVDGQPENIMPLTHSSVGGRIKICRR